MIKTDILDALLFIRISLNPKNKPNQEKKIITINSSIKKQNIFIIK